MNIIKLIIYTVLAIFLTLPLYAQSTQIRNFGGIALDRETEYIANYRIVEFDKLGLFDRFNPNTFWLPHPISCVPIKKTGTYMITARGIWSGDKTATGLRELSIRILRNGVWFTFAQNITSSSKDPLQEQRVKMKDILYVGDCIGTLAYFTSQTSNINFGVTALLITKINRRRILRTRRNY